MTGSGYQPGAAIGISYDSSGSPEQALAVVTTDTTGAFRAVVTSHPTSHNSSVRDSTRSVSIRTAMCSCHQPTSSWRTPTVNPQPHTPRYANPEISTVLKTSNRCNKTRANFLCPHKSLTASLGRGSPSRKGLVSSRAFRNRQSSGRSCSDRSNDEIKVSSALRSTFCLMSSLTIRTDPEVEGALDALTSSGLSRSEAARAAILEASRENRRAQLRAEVEALRNDPEDVAASRALAAEMDAIRAW